MSITIYGLVCLTLVAIALYKNNANMMLALLILGMNFQSASVFVLNGQGVGFQLVISTIFMLWIFFYSNIFQKGKLIIVRSYEKQKFSIVAALFLGIYCVIVTKKMSINYENSFIILYLLQFLIYISCYVSMWFVHKRYSYMDIDKIMTMVITVICVIGIIQLVTTVNIFPKNVILETFIYTKDTRSAYYTTNYYPRLFSVFMEPSYCAAFLVGSFYYIISKEKLDKYCVRLAIVLLVEILLTFSSTAYGAFFVTGLIYLALCKNKKALKWLIPLAIVMGMLLLATGVLQQMLNDVIFSKGTSGSGVTRAGWDRHAMTVFQENPWFGVGYKGVRGSHLYTSILGQLGIVGTTLYVLMILPLIIAGLKSKRTTSAALFLIGSIISQLIALPDLDFCVFWEGMYIMALMLGMAKGESGYESVNNNSGI